MLHIHFWRRFLWFIHYFSSYSFLSFWVENSICYFRRKGFDFLIFWGETTAKSMKRMLKSFFRGSTECLGPLRTERLSFYNRCIEFLIDRSWDYSGFGWYSSKIFKPWRRRCFLSFFRGIFCVISNRICSPESGTLVITIFVIAVSVLDWFFRGYWWASFDLLYFSLHFSYFRSE